MVKRFLSIFNSGKISLVLVSILILTNSCSKTTPSAPPTPPAPTVVSIAGGSISIPATDSPILLTSQEILDSNDLPVKDGLVFDAKGDGLDKVSLDGVTFSDAIKVSSVGAKVKFYVLAPHIIGTYKVQVTQDVAQLKNANGYFFVEITPNTPVNLGAVTSSRFEDVAPYTGIYQVGDVFSALADGSTTVQISVGPITDQFGNIVQNVPIQLLSDKGQVTSTNPTLVSDGFVFFTYLPSTDLGQVNFTAKAVNEQQNIVLATIQGSIMQVAPNLTISPSGNFGPVNLGETQTIKYTITNTGTTSSTGLLYTTVLPWSLPFVNECPQVLHPNDTCQITLQLSSIDLGAKTGTFKAAGMPATIPNASVILPLTTNISSPPSLVLSSNTVGFTPTPCGTTSSQNIYVSNLGQSDATNFTVVQPLQVAGQSVNAFQVIAPVADPSFPSDPNVIVNCGTTIPAGGRKCRLTVKFNPTALLNQQSVVARIQADNIDPVSLTIGASAISGPPAGTIPITLNPQVLNLSTNSSVTVTAGPVKDSCNNIVDNTVAFTSSVTAGSLDKVSGNLIAGTSFFAWTGSNKLTDLGNQTFNISSGVATGSASLNFSGLNLSLSGPTDLGEITLETPQTFNWTLTNNGNGTASSIGVTFPVQTNVIVSGINSNSCQSLVAGASCSFSAVLAPVLQTSNTVSFNGSISVIAQGSGNSNANLNYKGYGHKLFALVNGDVPYSLGNQTVGVPLVRTISLYNATNAVMSGLTYAFNGPSVGWNVTNGNCASTLVSQANCNITIQYSSTVAGTKTAVLKIQNSVTSTNLDLTLNMTPGDPSGIIAVVPVSNSLPADGSSTTSVNIGPILDVYGNIITVGTQVSVSADKGTIVEAQPEGTDPTGRVVATYQVPSSQVGLATINVTAPNSLGAISERGSAQINLTGVALGFSSSLLDFGSIPMGSSADLTVTLQNTGNIQATGLTILATSNFSIIDKGTCLSGSLAIGASCIVKVRFTAPLASVKSDVTGVLTAKSSVMTGQNITTAQLHGINLIPATLISDVSTVSVQLVPNSIYTTTITFTNIGEDAINNFVITSSSPAVSLSSFGGCSSLAGGASCAVTLTFNANGIISALEGIITATATGTSTQISFTSDFIHLAFVNSTFVDNVMTCHPIQIEAQDLNGNAMSLESTILISLGSSKLGTFYQNHLCAGTTISKIGIFPGDSSSGLIYFQPKLAGIHVLTAAFGTALTATQSDVANLVVQPSNVMTVAPNQSIAFTALGANGNLACSFIQDASHAVSPIPVSGQTCNYRAGLNGSSTDTILLSDSDTPPNTASIQVTTTPSIFISPPSSIVDSGAQVQFSATGGSDQNYTFSIIPNQPTTKIGSSIFNNLYTAGQNITGTDLLQETVVVTDSLGATAQAKVFVHPSIFKQAEIITPSSIGVKNIAVWKNFMVVGNPTDTVGPFANAGSVSIYHKITNSDASISWNLTQTIATTFPVAGGAFGSAVSMFNNLVVVGAPHENSGQSNGSVPDVGAIYYFSFDSNGNVSGIQRILNRSSGSFIANDEFGGYVSISQNYISASSSLLGSSLVVYNINNLSNTNPNANCNIAPCSENVQLDDFTSGIAVFDNDNYGGTYLAVGYPNVDTAQITGSGSVHIKKREVTDSGVEWQNADEMTLPPDPSVLEANEAFGSAVTMYGPYVAVGSPNKNSGKGQVTVYRRDPNLADNNWGEAFVIKATDLNAQINEQAHFGQTIAQFGNYLMIGAPGENNYPNTLNAGAVYLFQRYLSEDNKWQYLGEVHSTNYASNDNYGSSLALYFNDFLVESNNPTNSIYYLTGGAAPNAWPFGYHGILSLTGGAQYTQTMGTMKDWSSLLVDNSSSYSIAATPGVSNWSHLGIAGQLNLTGAIVSNGSDPLGVVSANAPDESGFNLGEVLSFDTEQGVGGTGAVGAYGQVRANICDGNGNCGPYSRGYAHPDGFGDAGDPGANASGRDGGAGGLGASIVTSGNGQGTYGWFDGGHNGCYHIIRGYDSCFATAGCNGGNGASGGIHGGNGSNLYIKARQILGNGTVYSNGAGGGTGGQGDQPVEVGTDTIGGDDSDWLQKYSGHDGPSPEFANLFALGGQGGGGGGGAGGSGGQIIVEGDTTGANLLSYNTSGGIGGAPGNATNYIDHFTTHFTSTCQAVETQACFITIVIVREPSACTNASIFPVVSGEARCETACGAAYYCLQAPSVGSGGTYTSCSVLSPSCQITSQTNSAVSTGFYRTQTTTFVYNTDDAHSVPAVSTPTVGSNGSNGSVIIH